jgi:hypothetical protein
LGEEGQTGQEPKDHQGDKMSTPEKLNREIEIAKLFHAALLSNPSVVLNGNKAEITTHDAGRFSVVDYAKREARLFCRVHYEIPGNEDK